MGELADYLIRKMLTSTRPCVIIMKIVRQSENGDDEEK